MAYIYVITNRINNKQYIGKTNGSIEKRFQEHINDSKRIRCEKRPLYNAINKYGVKNFSIEQLEECSIEEVSDREIYWIDKLNTFYNGYNATHGGDGKILYDYKEIANKYLELKNQKETAQFFNCDITVVKHACEEYNIPIINSAREKNKKSVLQYSLDGVFLRRFDSISDAANFLRQTGECKSKVGSFSPNKHIVDVCNNKRKTAYKYKWKWENNPI